MLASSLVVEVTQSALETTAAGRPLWNVDPPVWGKTTVM